MTLTEFLLARIAEDEADARTAVGIAPGDDRTPSDWWVKEEHSMVYAGHWVPVVETAERSIPNGEGDGVITWRVPATLDHIARHDPARVLAECEAKRRIVKEIEALRGQRLAPPGSASLIMDYSLDRALRHLALPYADHPDYDDAWRP